MNNECLFSAKIIVSQFSMDSMLDSDLFDYA